MSAYTLQDARVEIALLRAAVEELKKVSAEHDAELEEHAKERAESKGRMKLLALLGAVTVGATTVGYNILSVVWPWVEHALSSGQSAPN